MNNLRRNLPILVILLIYVTCILVADPRGDFPLNDDWSYTRSAFALASGRGLKVDPWVAPSLIGQALYGGLLTKIFSQSFLVLRASTLLLSCFTLLLFWEILLRTGLPKKTACIILLAWTFNPIQFNLSFTFMTEIPFIFFIALALYLYIVHLESNKISFLLLSSAALGYAFLIRQTALLFILALLCSIILDTRKSMGERVRQLVPTSGVAAIFIAGYYLWVGLSGGETPALRRKFQLLDHLEMKQFVGNTYGMLFYLAFMLLPLLIYLVPRAVRLLKDSHRILRFGNPAAWCTIVTMGVWWFHAHYRPSDYLPAVSYHTRMPYLLNVMYDTGLGPVTLDPTYFRPPATPTYPLVWWVVTVLVAVGVVLAGTFCVSCLKQPGMQPLADKSKPLVVFAGLSFFCLAIFEVVFSHLQEGGLFDRHILILSFPLLLLLGLCSVGADVPEGQWPESKGTGRAFTIAAGMAVLALGLFCVTATHDYMTWNRVRWEMGRRLLSERVNPLSIAGGFEFNAWDNYDVFVARGKISQTNQWWYDKRDFIISMEPQRGYEVRESRTYFSWVHRRPIPLYVLQKKREVPLFPRKKGTSLVFNRPLQDHARRARTVVRP